MIADIPYLPTSQCITKDGGHLTGIDCNSTVITFSNYSIYEIITRLFMHCPFVGIYIFN